MIYFYDLKNCRYIPANGQSTKHTSKTDRYVSKNGRGHLTFMQSTQATLRQYVGFQDNK